MIYFIQAGKNGPIKIGKTNGDIADRLAQLQTGCPYKLRVLWLYYGDKYTESKIHKIFEHEKLHGEWFHPSGSLYEFIKSDLSNTQYFYTQEIGPIRIEERMGHQSCHFGTGVVVGRKNSEVYIGVDDQIELTVRAQNKVDINNKRLISSK
jgi:hypothetical protein